MVARTVPHVHLEQAGDQEDAALGEGLPAHELDQVGLLVVAEGDDQQVDAVVGEDLVELVGRAEPGRDLLGRAERADRVDAAHRPQAVLGVVAQGGRELLGHEAAAEDQRAVVDPAAAAGRAQRAVDEAPGQQVQAGADRGDQDEPLARGPFGDHEEGRDDADGGEQPCEHRGELVEQREVQAQLVQPAGREQGHGEHRDHQVRREVRGVDREVEADDGHVREDQRPTHVGGAAPPRCRDTGARSPVRPAGPALVRGRRDGQAAVAPPGPVVLQVAVPRVRCAVQDRSAVHAQQEPGASALARQPAAEEAHCAGRAQGRPVSAAVCGDVRHRAHSPKHLAEAVRPRRGVPRRRD